MWSLRVVRGAEQAEKLLPQMRLPQPLQCFTIGRESTNQWAIADRARAISARHCEIVDSPHGPLLRDLSTNGTFVNGAATRLRGEHLLRDGDRIELGPVLIEVSGPPMPPRPAAPSAPPVALFTPGATPSATPGAAAGAAAIRAAAPQRGGDPAAMLAHGGGATAEGLTELLRVAARPQDSGVELTKIRAVPAAPVATPQPSSASAHKASAMPAASATAGATATAPAAAAAPAAPQGVVSSSALTEALARGLGLPAAALAGQDPLLLVERLASCAVAAASALRLLMEHQALARRSIGSRLPLRTPALAANPLRVASSAQAAALALATGDADPAAVLHRSADELCAHQTQLLQAFHSAVQRLAAQIEPATLQATLPATGGTSESEQARLWQLYTALWSAMGPAPAGGWSGGLQEAARQHLAAAYDEAQRWEGPS